MTRWIDKTQILLAGGTYLLASQPAFAQARGHGGGISMRGVIVFLVIVAGAYWLAGYYFKNRRRHEEAGDGFRLPPAAWFVIAAITAAIANVLLMTFVMSVDPRNDIFAGTVALFYFLFGWILPGTVVALAQMMQTPAPVSLLESHNKVMIPTLGGYFLTMLWMNDIGRALGVTG